MREGSSATILYATRLALRVTAYARLVLRGAAAAAGGGYGGYARGLTVTPEMAAALAEGTAALRGVIEDHALPVLQVWRLMKSSGHQAVHRGFIKG